MPPTHTIQLRDPTSNELQTIRQRKKTDFASYGCITLFFGLIPIFLLSVIGHLFLPQTSIPGAAIGALIGLGIFLCSLFVFIPRERLIRRKAALDGSQSLVQEVAVNDPKVIEIHLTNDRAPILAFDIGNGALLLLQGQWLTDNPEIYGIEPLGDEPIDEQYLNGLPPPYSFPNSSFTLSRLPNSGEVLGIRSSGTYIRPEQTIDAMRAEYNFANSELLSGDLERIAEVLAHEHRARSASQK